MTLTSELLDTLHKEIKKPTSTTSLKLYLTKYQYDLGVKAGFIDPVNQSIEVYMVSPPPPDVWLHVNLDRVIESVNRKIKGDNL